MSAGRPSILPVSDRSDAIGALAGSTGSLEERLAELRYTVITQALPALAAPYRPRS